MVLSRIGRREDRVSGFTLIELLVVVAIISILSSIAVPNFLEAQTRAKVAAVTAGMRTMVTAVESYRLDHNSAPHRRNSRTRQPTVPIAGERLQQLASLTTPIAYLTLLPVDFFEHRLPPPNNVIDYYDPTQTSWAINKALFPTDPRRVAISETPYLLVSVGPDGYLGATSGSRHGWPSDTTTHGDLGTMYMIYDPTNGIISPGNIYSGMTGAESMPRYLRATGAFK